MNACSYIHEHDGRLRVITKYLDDVIHDLLTEIPIHHKVSTACMLHQGHNIGIGVKREFRSHEVCTFFTHLLVSLSCYARCCHCDYSGVSIKYHGHLLYYQATMLAIVNPRRACARVTVVVLCVCLCIRLFLL